MKKIAISIVGVAWMTVLAGSNICSAQSADYKLDRGDIVGISVFGIPDFSRRTMLNVDGNISLPLIGNVQAAGLTISELQKRLTTHLLQREVARGAEVMVEIAEHRPYFISGDVTTPGALPWRVDCDVRRAVALAGGLSASRTRNTDTPQEAAELQGRYNALLAEYAKREARLKGLEAELAGKSAISFDGAPPLALPEKIVSDIKNLEQRNLVERQRNLQNERRHLSEQIVISEEQITALRQGKEQDQINVAQQIDALRRATSLQGKGLANVARVSDEQRALALIKSRELETLARLGRARQDQQEQKRKLQRASDDRLIQLTRELQEALVELQQTRSLLIGAAERLLLAQSPASDRNVDYMIYRRNGGTESRISATAETRVEPGDVIEVILKFEKMLLVPSGIVR